MLKSFRCTFMIQVLVCLTTFSIYGRPEGFPIEAESWLCTGDYCDIVQTINLEKISGGNPACVLSFSKSANTQYIQAFLFLNGSITSSDKQLFGDLSGETGNTIQVDYFNFKEAQGCVTVSKKLLQLRKPYFIY